MGYQWLINLGLMLAVLGSGLAQQTANTSANVKTQQVLNYIAGLPQQGIFILNKF